MDETADIRAIETIRAIRDELAERLRKMNDTELVEFFRQAGAAAREDAKRRFGKPPAAA